MKLIKNKSYHNKGGTRLYRIFENMLARCYRPSNKSYKYCGAKGITICDEWLENKSKFFEWAENNGYNENLTIDRIDNQKGYSPDNCRWVDSHLQATNKRKQKNNKTGYTGIYFCNTEKLYKAQISVNNKCHTLGRFKTIKEALDVRNNYIKEHNLPEYKIQ